MAVHVIKRGLDLPITGAPEQQIHPGPEVRHVAVMADDFPLMRPRMHVNVGDTVKRGQLLFDDRKSENVRFTAPGAGKVVGIHRGEKRVLQSVVIELSEGERRGQPGDDEHVLFDAYKKSPVDQLSGDEVRALLAESGLWSALRARPFGRVPSPTETCHSIFVTCTDTHPLTAEVAKVLEGKQEDFHRGLKAVAKLTEGTVWLCKAPGLRVPTDGVPRLRVEEFSGKHPAGLVGTHIHLLDPVHRAKTVWHVGYQHVVAIGRLFATGRLDVERVVALAGPMVKKPRLIKTRMGAATDALVAGELAEGAASRVISGSVLGGRKAMGEVWGYLGAYPNQVSVVAEGGEREFFGWLAPGANKFSVIRTFFSALTPKKTFNFTTDTQGSPRAMVPIGMYEKVMPLDIMPTFLLRALMVGDIERAEALGIFELEEEDLALCSFVDPGKEDFAPHLRRLLTRIWKEG